ncbi:AAA family ATPase [Mycolicibacterium sp. 120266]|uniref:ATP-dependent nuclease n=1 Tax=Mycolicibacterium sp. 120266 TaxID=3090601 RepID=UPI00299DE08C|nr:AAA family ATPase [Mycolicibacterium sp. 120266]MDX1874015.1 AAA family ATPase [Mycolicibacterium sp. 120266]
MTSAGRGRTLRTKRHWRQLISKMRMVNFKGFENFTLNLGGRTSILVGPNNAGKSTAIGALRLSAHLLSYSKMRKSDFTTLDTLRGRSVHAYRLSSAPAEFIAENIAHEFREVEARVEIQFKNRAALYIVWPIDDQPFYYLEHIAGAQPPSLQVTRRDYPSVGVVQTLTPVEHRETVLSEDHIKKSIGTRLASKHFRNQLYLTQANDPEGYSQYIEFALQHTPELTGIEVVRSKYNADLDLFFTEYKSRVEKEIYWAGDGLQIWLQLLFHIWRLRNCNSIILDEPDVYLHPDLQRRLVGILEDLSSQVILSTHAPEILAESSRDAVVLLDRTRRSSKKVSSAADLSALNNALGSGFNLRLAKALRSKTVLFVEGKDMKILSNLARTIGATNFHRENGLTVIPMGGSSKRRLAESFGWVNKTLLDSSVRVAVYLDRDYLDQDAVNKILKEFQQNSIVGWRVPVSESTRFWSRGGVIQIQLMLQAIGVWVHLQTAAYSAGVR